MIVSRAGQELPEEDLPANNGLPGDDYTGSVPISPPGPAGFQNFPLSSSVQCKTTFR